MVGYFPPLVHRLEKENVSLSVVDDARGMGDKKTFYKQLDGWADVLLITATSILNNSTETILSQAGPDLKIVLLGPSTPMIPEAFAHLPVHMLAGSAITDPQRALKIVRHSGGYPRPETGHAQGILVGRIGPDRCARSIFPEKNYLLTSVNAKILQHG
jgi:uncharacterized protein (DUF4213/DUF364 family)